VYAFIISIGVSFLALSARIIILRWQHHFPAFQYIKKVLIPILTLVVVTLPVVWVMHSYLGDPTSIVTLLLDIVLLVVITLIFAYSACMDKSEKQNMAKAIKQLKGKIWKQ
jgi:hypothetical protein